MPERIRTHALTLDVGGVRRVGPLDLAMPQQGVTAIMGPNGAGKSLLLRLLHGLVTPTSGSVETGTRRQAMVFQKPVMLRRSVAQNLLFVLRRRAGIDDPDGECRRILARIGLADRARQPAQALSGGEKQRLALARALATDPAILFLDEPTASLDPASTLAIESMIDEAAKSGVKVVIVTHDIGQARRLAKDIVFLHKGLLVEHNDVPEFFENPISAQARAYLDGRILL